MPPSKGHSRAPGVVVIARYAPDETRQIEALKCVLAGRRGPVDTAQAPEREKSQDRDPGTQPATVCSGRATMDGHPNDNTKKRSHP